MKKKQTKRRNAAPSSPLRPARARPADKGKDEEATEDTPLRRLGMSALGAAGTAFLGSFLAREGWAPKTIATALGAVGAGLAWKGDTTTTQQVGTGVMSAAGGQLVYMAIADHQEKDEAAKKAEADAKAKETATHAQAPAPKPREAEGVPEAMIARSFEGAKARLAMQARRFG